MNELKKILFKRDKLYHLIVGTVIYLLALIVLPHDFALIPVFIAGIFKETIDMYSKTDQLYNAVPKFLKGWAAKYRGTADPFDYFATIALPCIIALIITIIKN